MVYLKELENTVPKLLCFETKGNVHNLNRGKCSGKPLNPADILSLGRGL